MTKHTEEKAAEKVAETKTHTYACKRCRAQYPYTYTAAEIAKRGTERACIWGGCSGTAIPVAI